MVTINNTTYEVKSMSSSDYMFIKNGEPALLIPDDLFEDFVKILSYAGAASKFMAEAPQDEDQKVNILTGTKPS